MQYTYLPPTMGFNPYINAANVRPQAVEQSQYANNQGQSFNNGQPVQTSRSRGGHFPESMEEHDPDDDEFEEYSRPRRQRRGTTRIQNNPSKNLPKPTKYDGTYDFESFEIQFKIYA